LWLGLGLGFTLTFALVLDSNCRIFCCDVAVAVTVVFVLAVIFPVVFVLVVNLVVIFVVIVVFDFGLCRYRHRCRRIWLCRYHYRRRCRCLVGHPTWTGSVVIRSRVMTRTKTLCRTLILRIVSRMGLGLGCIGLDY
jgi:hypothetical protein